ncbi:MAG: hypothetical protein B7Y48_07200 [Methylophilales bacterium 28-44-11]|nr:MAG: hypothetical protein B7Y48_07200 [Methylophilales bacterium 28-44-11]
MAYATQKRIAKKIPLIVANDISIAMGQDVNQVTLIDDAGTHTLSLADKTEVASQILQHVVSMIST